MEPSCEEQCQNLEVAGFIAKTFEILNNDQYSRIIFWSPSGSEFIIKDTNKFQQVVLPKYFRHNKINSFIRQLNMYGFHKSRKEHSKSVFSHPMFLKDREELLPEIKRKIKLNQSQTLTASCSFQTPVKKQKYFTEDQIKTDIKENVEPKEKGSMKNFAFLDSFASSFKQLIGSRQNFSSKQHLNFSLNKISLNCIDEGQKDDFKAPQNQKCDEVISIEDGIEHQERQRSLLDLPGLDNFQNPSLFFNSFILKE